MCRLSNARKILHSDTSSGKYTNTHTHIGNAKILNAPPTIL